ncbi:hypothetical protein [Fodinicola acaciae]|uniref:hypothetical protein n=1 Tax=Fodinicola acaciae TaxID=2681555 RepID=UPI0013D6ABF3|nr:hypothetical protein [Fodinicola acaciae]
MSDPLDRIFSRPEPLAPPQGHFDTISRRAKGRKMRQAGVVCAAFVLVAGVGTAGAAVLHNRANSGDATALATNPSSPRPQTFSEKSATPRATDSGLQKPVGSAKLPTGFKPYSVTTVAATTYVLGDSTNCGGKKCTVMVRKEGPGQPWRTVPGPQAPTAAATAAPEQTEQDTVREVRFATQLHGFAYGGGLYSTHNGGASWHKQPVGGTVLDLAIKDGTAYALVGQCDSGTCSQVAMWSSATRQDDWQQVSGVPAGSGSGELSFGRGGVALVGKQVYAFRDGAWKAAAAPCDSDQPRSIAASAAASRLFAICPSGDAGAGNASYTTVYSDDSGRSWQQQKASALRLSNAPQTTFTSASSTVLLVGDADPSIGEPRLQVSRDGGDTFHTVAGGLPDRTGGWRYVGAIDAQSLVALPAQADGNLFTSSDAGEDWSATDLSGP